MGLAVVVVQQQYCFNTPNNLGKLCDIIILDENNKYDKVETYANVKRAQIIFCEVS